MSLVEYAKSSMIEDNYMVRVLTNTTKERSITQNHLEVAKEIIGRKCLVGFLDRMSEAMEHFAKFFRWEEVKSIDTLHGQMESKERDAESKWECLRNATAHGANRHAYARLTDPASEAWLLLQGKDIYDLQLYEFARAMYAKVGHGPFVLVLLRAAYDSASDLIVRSAPVRFSNKLCTRMVPRIEWYDHGPLTVIVECVSACYGSKDYYDQSGQEDTYLA